MANPGKNKSTRWMRVFVSGYNLSGDARTFGELMNRFEGIDYTGWSESVHNYLSDGRRMVGITGFQAFVNDTAGRAFAALKHASSLANRGNVSMLFGGGAEPEIGDVAYHIPSIQIIDTTGFDGGAGVINADFRFDTADFTANFDAPFGVVAHPETSLSATTNGASINNGASSPDGLSAVLHVPVSSGGTWVFKVQDSPDNSAWADVLTFSANGSAVASEFASASGTVDQYIRFQATRTSGTVTPVCTVARN